MGLLRRISNILVLLSFSWLGTANAANIPITATRASSNESAYPPQNAADGSSSTRWSCVTTASTPCWLRLDIGSAQSIAGVSIRWYGATRQPFAIAIAGADFNYATVASGESSGNTASAETYSFTPRSGRFVKITVGDNPVHRAIIVEATVSNTGGVAAPTPTSAAAPAPTPTPATSGSDAGQKDVFGVTKKYSSFSGGKSWTSAHWNNGKARYIVGKDPDDPTGISENRSDQAQLWVDGKGVLQFIGSGAAAEPRFHLNGVPATFFKNVEITFYYWKTSDADVNWGGMVIGARSGPEGHSQSAQYCDAHTYYGRFRNDGKWDFEKELKHPASSTRNGTNIWNGATDLPANKWIGMKYIAVNTTVSGKPAVKLELWRDQTGGTNGGTWEKIGETVDSGGWAPPQNAPACPNKPTDFVPADGGGVIVLRNTGSIKDAYKWMSVREIQPPS